MPELLEGWATCPTCPRGDNRWPASAFSNWYRAQHRSRPRKPVCNSCLFARYPRVFKPCTACGGLMYFRADRVQAPNPVCLPCRRSGEPICERCGESLADRQQVGESCLACFLRHSPAPALEVAHA